MRVLLFGGNTKLSHGYFVGQKLLARGHTVVALTSESWRFDCGFEWVTGELEDTEGRREIERADAIIDTEPPVAIGSQKSRISELRPARLMRALEGSGKPLIVSSDALVLGDTGTTPVDETARVRPPENCAYLARLEKKILSARGVHTAILRTAHIHGCSPLTIQLTAWLILAHRLRRATYIEPGTTRWSAVHYDDLAELYCLALEKAAVGSVIHAAAETFSMKELAGAIQRGMGKPGEPRGISLEQATAMLHYAPALCRNEAISGEMAKRTLGWKPAGPSYLEEAEQETRAPRIFKGSRNLRSQ